MRTKLIKDNNCLSFMKDSLENDLIININDIQINVNKSVLVSESHYFKAMFDNEWKESNSKCVRLEETPVKPLIIVLRLVYAIYENDQQLNKLETEQLIQSIIVANRYQFNTVERTLSEKMVENFPQIREIDSNTLATVCDVFEMSKISRFFDLSKQCLQIFDENADKVLTSIDKLLIRPETLIEIISRDSFGVKEIDLFSAIIDWITKTRVNVGYDWGTKERVLRATRFHLISDQDMENYVKPALTKLFIGRKIDSILEALINKYLNETTRLCIQTEAYFICYDFQIVQSSYRFNTNPRLSPNPCIFYTFDIPLMTKMNCIQFEIIPITKSDDTSDMKSINYIIEVRDIQTKHEEEWRKIINYSKYDCIGLQEVYFEELVTNGIRIVCLSSEAEPQFLIRSVSYKYTKNPLKLFNNNIVRPLNDVTAIDGAKCLLRIGGNEELITNYILKDNKDYESNQYFLVPFLKLNLGSSIDFKTYYFIKFSQPFAIDSFQFDLKLENLKSLVKYKAVFEVSILSNGSFTTSHDSKDWVKVTEDLVEESMTRNVIFDLQTVSVIRICGFRFKANDEDFRTPLHISRIRVVSNHSNFIHRMLSCFRNP